MNADTVAEAVWKSARSLQIEAENVWERVVLDAHRQAGMEWQASGGNPQPINRSALDATPSARAVSRMYAIAAQTDCRLEEARRMAVAEIRRAS